MIAVNRILEYQYEVAEVLRGVNNEKMFNYVDMVIDDSELASVLKERVDVDNTFLISVLPSFSIKGTEDNSEWINVLNFFILDKTDYSEHDRDSFRKIFVSTQLKANAFVLKLLEDRGDQSLGCNWLIGINESSIRVNPVWKVNGCNGFLVEFSLSSSL